MPDPEGEGERDNRVGRGGERGAMVKTFFNGSSLNADEDDGLGEKEDREGEGSGAGHAHFARNLRYLSSRSHPAVVCGRQ